MRVVLVTIAVLVSVGTLGGLGILAFGLATSRVVIFSHPLPADMRSLTIDTGNVSVPVRLSTDADATESRIDLRMLVRSDHNELTVESDDVDTRVTFGDYRSGYFWLDTLGEMKVILSPDVAQDMSVTINHRTGSLFADADLDRLTAKTDDGDVTLDGSARAMNVHVLHGAVKTSARIAVAESFSATVESGNISVDFSAAPHNTEVSAGGDIDLRLPGPGPYRVHARSERLHGETVTVPETDDREAPAVKASSTSGNVRITELG
ncbi:hypothetical protein AU193_19595 [Mycobacterium sp. GA-1285]|uniref:DUF4097 family beta strand repeat-containing protein n=1 Tax=Mycobacterium sp. GA-1285 TaxID=1772282 RepID=UPI000746F615|nr:DUF4097 family beta strand repeat-containing protein [Mycobacterium sp. GA-1285]KUI11597.1 hypothetical protein AU193_19595 [Mycobacterium sp. GA-1285]